MGYVCVLLSFCFSLVLVVSGGRLAANPICLEEKAVGRCAGTRMFYYFNKQSKRCVLEVFSSCPGSENYFVSKPTCELMCKSYIDSANPRTHLLGEPDCLSPLNPGKCGGSNRMVYHFDQVRRICRYVAITSCPRSANYFFEERDCRLKCAKYMAVASLC